VAGKFFNSQREFMVAWRENISHASVQVAAFGWQDWTATACAARKGSGPAATFLDFFAWKAYFDFARDGLLEGVAWAALVTPLRADSRHGSELFLRYLDAAWADCVVSVQPELRFFYGVSSQPRSFP
jgi:hypothetical protein